MEWYRSLPPERRQELRERWNNMTPEQKREFTERRERLRQMTPEQRQELRRQLRQRRERQ
jgi:hypothetical protein